MYYYKVTQNFGSYKTIIARGRTVDEVEQDAKKYFQVPFQQLLDEKYYTFEEITTEECIGQV